MGQPVRQRWESQPIPQGLRIGQHQLRSERQTKFGRGISVMCSVFSKVRREHILKDKVCIFQVRREHILKDKVCIFQVRMEHILTLNVIICLKRKKWLRHRNYIYKISVPHYNTHRRV